MRVPDDCGGATAPVAEDCSFGVLRVGAVEVAIPAADLQEVVIWPGAITPRPLAAPYVLGTFSLRGMAIPTVDLRVLFFGPSEPQSAPPQPAQRRLADHTPLTATPARTGPEKVVIVRRPAGRLGLVVDGVSDLVRLTPERMHRLAAGDAARLGQAQALISQLFMTDRGARIVHVMDLDALARLPDVVLAKATEASTAAADRLGPMRQYLTFRCADLSLCLDATVVREIVEVSTIEQNFLTSNLYRGLVRLRGRAVPVLSLAALLQVGRSDGDAKQLLVMEMNGQPLALLISRVTAIVKRRDGDVLPLPGFGLARSALFAGVMPEATEDLLLLSHEALARHEEVGPLGRVHATLYDEQPGGVAAGPVGRARKPGRHAYLTYSAGHRLSSPLAHIGEIIEFPERLIRLGTEGGLLAGMLKRRSVMIPVVDLRGLLGQGAADWMLQPKVLLIPGNRTTFGFIVDAVDAIEFVGPDQDMITAGQVVVARGSHPALGRLLQLAIVERGNERHSMSLLDLAGLARALEADCGPAPADATANPGTREPVLA